MALDRMGRGGKPLVRSPLRRVTRRWRAPDWERVCLCRPLSLCHSSSLVTRKLVAQSPLQHAGLWVLPFLGAQGSIF